MSSKKKPTPPRPSTVISLDALLGNWPTIELAGITFEGRHFNQTEKAAWTKAEQADDAPAQREVILAAIQARGGSITSDWLDAQPDVFLVALVRGLYGLGWPGENPK